MARRGETKRQKKLITIRVKKYGQPIEEIPGAYLARKVGLVIHLQTSVKWNHHTKDNPKNYMPDDAPRLKEIFIHDDMLLIQYDEGIGILIHANENVTTRTQIRLYKNDGRRFLTKKASQLNPGWVMQPVRMKSDLKYIDVLMDKVKHHSARFPPPDVQRTILWHGTSQRCADSIFCSGFRANTYF